MLHRHIKINVGYSAVGTIGTNERPIPVIDDSKILYPQPFHIQKIEHRIILNMRQTVLVVVMFPQSVMNAAIQQSSTPTVNINIILPSLAGIPDSGSVVGVYEYILIYTICLLQVAVVQTHCAAGVQSDRTGDGPYVFPRSGIITGNCHLIACFCSGIYSGLDHCTVIRKTGIVIWIVFAVHSSPPGTLLMLLCFNVLYCRPAALSTAAFCRKSLLSFDITRIAKQVFPC